MKCLWSILLVFVLPQWSAEVELNMQGTVNLGKDVVEALSRYIEKNKLGGRRSFRHQDKRNDAGDRDSDTIARMIKSAYLCRDLDFCTGDLETLLNKYIIMLTEGIETVFKGLVNDINKNNDEDTEKVVIFGEELKGTMKDIKTLIRNANADVRDTNVGYAWVNLIKKISTKFLDRAISFGSQRLEGNADEILEVKKNLTQKIVIVVSLIELKFENLLCSQHGICAKSYECTKALKVVFQNLITVPDERLKEFIKYFHETLSGTNFYNRLSDVTTHEFQAILRDMSETENILTKNIITTVHKSIEKRENIIVSKFKIDDSGFGRDVKLVHIILSDMDFFYSKQKDEPFHDFFGDFYDWTKEGGRLGTPLRRLMKDIQNKLSFAANDLVMKIIDEVKVFMEITVDPAS